MIKKNSFITKNMKSKGKLYLKLILADFVGALLVGFGINYWFPERILLQVIAIALVIFIITIIVFRIEDKNNTI